MMTVDTLLDLIDAYKGAAGVERDTTVSHRIFGDSKKIANLRGGGDLTTGRFNDAMRWLGDNWPEGRDRPPALLPHLRAGAQVNGACGAAP